jgi:hypothetical protein
LSIIKYNKSETVSSIGMLEAYHIAPKMGDRGVFHMHLSPFNSVEVFSILLVTVIIKYNKSETVSSIRILEACHKAQKTSGRGVFHMHLTSCKSVELLRCSHLCPKFS